MVDKKVIRSLGIYCRVSSKKQMDNLSLNNQKDRGIKYCEENEYGYETFFDVISGSKVKRDNLDILFKKIYDNELDGIVLYEWDRLQRENKELLIEFEKLVEDTNCVVIVDNRKRDIIGNLSDRIEYEFKNSFSSIERMRLKKRVGEGIHNMMERGNTTFGKTKFGYKNEGKKQTLHTIKHEDESKIVEEIFRIFNLKSTIKIDDCRKIINKKFDKDWSITFITNCLKWDGYKGETYQKWGKPSKLFKITIPKIIDEDLWLKSDVKLKKIQGLRKGRDKEDHLLKGIIYCKSCNDRLYNYSTTNHTTRQSWYKCKWGSKPQYEKNRILWENGNKCKCYRGNYINKDYLEIVVWDLLFKLLRESEDIKKIYSKKYNDNLKLKDSNKHKKKYYKIKIEEIETKKFNLYDDYSSNKIKRKDYDLYNKKYDLEIEVLEKRENEIDINIDSFTKLKKDDFKVIEDIMKKDLELQYKLESYKDRKRLIDKYIKKIYVKRLDDVNYCISFDMEIDVKNHNYKFNNTYIKNKKLWH